jgi:HKD family nuclease
MLCELIINDVIDNKNHLPLLKDLIKNSKEVFIAVAFLKQTGLSLLQDSLKQAVKSKNKIVIIVGRDFCISEPKALKKIFTLFKKTPDCELRLAKLTEKNFHPKMYLFRNNNVCEVLVGSANMTWGGICDNWECSLHHTCKPNDDVWRASEQYFIKLLDNSIKASIEELDRYQKKYDKKPRFDITNENNQQLSDFIDFRKLDTFVNLFERSSFKSRKESYDIAKEKLKEIQRSTSTECLKILNILIHQNEGNPRLWGSNRLYRHKPDLSTSLSSPEIFRKFKSLITYILNSQHRTPQQVFKKGNKIIEGIPGLGVNFLTEIMITCDYDRFPILNGAVVNSLKDLLKDTNTTIKGADKFTDSDYVKLCNLINYIKNKYNFSNLLEVDSFIESYQLR